METNLPKSQAQQFFVARQPIFNLSGKVWGFELLFRTNSEQEWIEIQDPELATFAVSTCGFIRSQVDTDADKKIFINFPEKLILEGAPIGLPPTVTVVEILETVPPTDEIVEAVIALKQEGFLVAVDDYLGEPDRRPLLDYADIVKVEVIGKTRDEVASIIESLGDSKAIRLAEKVEDKETLAWLEELGFTLFQGFYFAKPVTLSGRKLQAGVASKLRLLKAIENEATDADQLAEIVRTDPSITYRLLRFLNSAAFGFSVKIDTVRRAVMLIGAKRTKYWLRMVVMSDFLGKDKTPELYTMSLNRGRLLEELASSGAISQTDPQSLFLFGMLSLMEAMLDMPFKRLVKELPLPQEMLNGFLDPDSYYAALLDLAVAVERSDPDFLERCCVRAGVRCEDVAQASVKALAWAQSLSKHII